MCSPKPLPESTAQPTRSPLKSRLKIIASRMKKLRGDPDFIARGIAIGVFVGITPTFPFHTAIAIFLALIFKGSKPAAAIGVWIGNPFTMPFFYVGSYHIGMLISGNPIPYDLRYESLMALLELGVGMTAAMVIGGALLGIVPAVCAYFITRNVFAKLKMRHNREFHVPEKKRHACRERS